MAPKETRSITAKIKLRPAESELLRRVAAWRDMTMSELIRHYSLNGARIYVQYSTELQRNIFESKPTKQSDGRAASFEYEQ